MEGSTKSNEGHYNRKLASEGQSVFLAVGARNFFLPPISPMALLLFTIPFVDSITCNSQYCPNYALSRCGAIGDCDFGVCYDKYIPTRIGDRERISIESGCSTEFHSSIIGRCIGDTRRGYTCVCNNASYCNYNRRNFDRPNPHLRLAQSPLRHVTCLYTDDPMVCSRYGHFRSPCNITNGAYCYVGTAEDEEYVQGGSTDYIGYWERANARYQGWLCEEEEYKRRWLCTCRSDGCSTKVINEYSMRMRIDRSAPTVKCRRYENTRIDESQNGVDDSEDDLSSFCTGHVCYVEYERTVVKPSVDYDSEKHDHEPKVTEIRRTLGCRNFSHPILFYGWAYNKVYGNKQKGQMFCNSNMCNDYSLKTFENASFRLEASASRSIGITFFNIGSTIFTLFITAVLSVSSTG